ncbi:MAG: OmpH family outer membrane protein, partial [Acidobacteria bacterium]|nr:OmpH family outer membrane protein [Acidobacteriota bacterium]
MTKSIYLVPALAAAAALAPAQTSASSKVGIVHIQNAIVSTKDGQKAMQDLQTRFGPKKADFEKRQGEIAGLQDQLRKGSATLSEDAKNKLMRQIDEKTKSLNRDTEDAQSEVEQAESKIMQNLGSKMMAVINKYARDNRYTLIIDVSNPQVPVVFAADGIDITKEVIDLYDKNAPAATSAAPAAKPARPVTPAAAPAPKPA